MDTAEVLGVIAISFLAFSEGMIVAGLCLGVWT